MDTTGKKWLVALGAIVLITDLAVVFDIPVFRQVFSFLFLTILPGLLLLFILKLHKLGWLEKIVLSVGLSVSFIIFGGLLINNVYYSLGYHTPLSITSLLISFSVMLIALLIVGYRTNKEAFSFNPDFRLSSAEKIFLLVPLWFPVLSIWGTHIMNTTDNNTILMSLLFLIPVYVIVIAILHQKVPKRIYPTTLFTIAISLLLMLSLRSNHILGMDSHAEYYFFQTTFNNLHWTILENSVLDACLASTILPSIYQSFLDINGEYISKTIYAIIYSFAPLAVYIISKKYIGELYAFLASFYFIFPRLMRTPLSERTDVAVFFFALAIMVLLHDKIDPLKKRILFIVFMVSCIVSHYSTTYIFFFIVLGTFLGMEILSKKYTFKKVISLTIVLLFFAFVFFWYSQVTETAFNAGVGFIETTLKDLQKFFILESRGVGEALLGGGIMQKGIPQKIEFIFTWITFAFIAIGVSTMIKKYKEMVTIPGVELNHSKPNFLKNKFEIEYLVMVLVCSALLVIMVALPFIAKGYSMQRLYSQVLVILSICFVMGGITILKIFSFLKKALLKKPILRKKSFTKRSHYLRNNEKNGSEVRAYFIILLVLIPYFFCVTGVMYNMFDVPRQITLNSEGAQYDTMYVHDQESYGAKWLANHAEQKNIRIYTDFVGDKRLISQAGFSHRVIDRWTLMDERDRKIKGYIYLRYYNVVNGKLLDAQYEEHNITEYSDKFVGKGKGYNNGGAEIWK